LFNKNFKILPWSFHYHFLQTESRFGSHFGRTLFVKFQEMYLQPENLRWGYHKHLVQTGLICENGLPRPFCRQDIYSHFQGIVFVLNGDFLDKILAVEDYLPNGDLYIQRGGPESG